MQGAVEIDLHHPVDCRIIQHGDRNEGLDDPGIVDHAIDPARLCHEFCTQGHHRLTIRNVHHTRQQPIGSDRSQGPGFLQGNGIPVDRDHRSPHTQQSEGERPPHATSGSGDDDDPVLDFHVCGCVF